MNGEVQPSVFAIFYSWQAMYSTNSWQVRQFMIAVDLVFHREGILKSEVWNRLEAVQRSLWGSDKWAADYVTNIQLKINQSLHDGEQLTPSEKKNCRDRWDQGAFKNLACSIIFSLRKQTFLTLCAECYIYPPILYVYTHAVWFFPETVEILHIFLDFGKKEPNWLILMHLHCWKSSENSRALLAFSVYFFGPNIQLCYFLTTFGSGQLSTFNFGTLGDQVANNQL